jgi:hypothetical protein
MLTTRESRGLVEKAMLDEDSPAQAGGAIMKRKWWRGVWLR